VTLLGDSPLLSALSLGEREFGALSAFRGVALVFEALAAGTGINQSRISRIKITEAEIFPRFLPRSLREIIRLFREWRK